MNKIGVKYIMCKKKVLAKKKKPLGETEFFSLNIKSIFT